MFRTAARHSRFVRLLRFAIPAVILIIGAIIVWATYFSKHIPGIPGIETDGIIPVSGTKIKMERPRLTGYTNDQRPYELIARGAIQDLTRLEVLELEEIGAKIELRDGQRVNLTAINGVYDQKAEVLRLNDHITINSTSGYEGRLSEATINISNGNIVSESPVEVKLPNGMLTAKRLEVKDNGAFIRFSGGVEMDLKPEQIRPPPVDAAPAWPGPLPASETPPATTMQTSQRRGAIPP